MLIISQSNHENTKVRKHEQDHRKKEKDVLGCRRFLDSFRAVFSFFVFCYFRVFVILFRGVTEKP